jgi:Xaa-Pro aminopeptidase
MHMAESNVQYKDRLFNFLFGAEENKAWTLSLYNAVNGSHYTDPMAIEITTIREVMYLGMHNDTSFLISDEMDLYEQQSSYNPNMPLRMLQYAGNLYEKYVKQRKMNKYGSRLLKLPVPKLVVFYNGKAEQPDETILRLSDSFPAGSDPDIAVRVRMLNVNFGRNRKLMEDCKPLAEYAWLVSRVRKAKSEEELERVIDAAITEMPADYVIKAFLEEHRAEVKGMLLTEYDEVATMELFREEGRAEGTLKTLVALVKNGLLSPENAARQANMTVAEFEKQAALPLS